MTFKVIGTLKTEKIGPKLWKLSQSLTFDTPKGVIRVPKGYLTDHASVPRLFTAAVPPVQSCLAEASILHDWLYNIDSGDAKTYPRSFADLCLREVCISRGGSKKLAYTAWSAVRLGATRLYNKSWYIEKLAVAYPEFRITKD